MRGYCDLMVRPSTIYLPVVGRREVFLAPQIGVICRVPDCCRPPCWAVLLERQRQSWSLLTERRVYKRVRFWDGVVKLRR